MAGPAEFISMVMFSCGASVFAPNADPEDFEKINWNFKPHFDKRGIFCHSE
jgi:hypothetical protein